MGKPVEGYRKCRMTISPQGYQGKSCWGDLIPMMLSEVEVYVCASCGSFFHTQANEFTSIVNGLHRHLGKPYYLKDIKPEDTEH